MESSGFHAGVGVQQIRQDGSGRCRLLQLRQRVGHSDPHIGVAVLEQGHQGIERLQVFDAFERLGGFQPHQGAAVAQRFDEQWGGVVFLVRVGQIDHGDTAHARVAVLQALANA
ncbi:hypothetical protein D9M68_629440 [compost metagenome]